MDVQRLLYSAYLKEKWLNDQIGIKEAFHRMPPPLSVSVMEMNEFSIAFFFNC